MEGPEEGTVTQLRDNVDEDPYKYTDWFTDGQKWSVDGGRIRSYWRTFLFTIEIVLLGRNGTESILLKFTCSTKASGNCIKLWYDLITPHVNIM